VDPADLAREIERLRRLYAPLVFGDLPGAREAPAAFDVERRALCWHVVLRDVLEPDVDVEVLEDALVVRARLEERSFRIALCPVPHPFDARRARLRFLGEVLEVRIAVG